MAEVEDLGNVGDVATEVTAAAIGDGRIRKAKGARNGGTMNVICLHTAPLDAGQQAMMDAEETNDNYAFKIELPDAPPPSGTPHDQIFPRAGDVEGTAGRHQRQRHALGVQHRRELTADGRSGRGRRAHGARCRGRRTSAVTSEQKEPAAAAAR